jgi:hypothetical protein
MPSRPPFATNAQVLLTYNATNASDTPVALDSHRLTNMTRFPVEIREIRLMAKGNFNALAGAGGTGAISEASPAVHLDIKLGRYYVTNGFTPISIMAPVRFRSDYIARALDDAYSVGSPLDTTTANRRIVLRKPLYLRPGVGFRVNAAIPTAPFLLGVIAGTFTVTLSVALIGRYLLPTDPIPKTHEVPFFSYAWLSQNKLTSLEMDLDNPLEKTLDLTRIVGVKVLTTHNVGFGDEQFFIDPQAFTTPVEISYPTLEKVTEDPCIFTQLFGQGRTLPFAYKLPGSERVRIRLGVNAQEADNSTVYAGTTNRTVYQFGLLGSRVEDVP